MGIFAQDPRWNAIKPHCSFSEFSQTVINFVNSQGWVSAVVTFYNFWFYIVVRMANISEIIIDIIRNKVKCRQI